MSQPEKKKETGQMVVTFNADGTVDVECPDCKTINNRPQVLFELYRQGKMAFVCRSCRCAITLGAHPVGVIMKN